MNKSYLRQIIREEISKVLKELETSPVKPKTTPTTKPGTGKPQRLGNPNVKPAPKAKLSENEKQILAKIVNRFTSNKKQK